MRLAVNEDVALEIVDDGVGIPAGRSAGVGLSSMRERAAELGGSCVVETAPKSGTRVLARLPLPEGVRRLETLRILIAEDHPLFRKGMIALLSSVPDFEVVGEATTGEEAVARAARAAAGRDPDGPADAGGERHRGHAEDPAG